MGTFLRILFLTVVLGGIVVGIILVGQRQLLEKEASEISSALLNLRPTAAPTPTPGPDAGSIGFTVRFQGIITPGLTKTVSLTLKQADAEVYSFTNIPVSPRAGGIYWGKVAGLNPGVYDVSLKGEAYLTRKFPETVIKTGENSFDFSSKMLLAGDFDGNNKINVNDVGLISAKITIPPTRTDAGNQVFDLDGNGQIGSSDMDLMLSNYKGLEVGGE